jgi:hypothetical protein
MSRIRSVHPEQWVDDQFVTSSPLARLVAIGVRNFADDNGVFVWNPIKLKMLILPADNCDMASLLDELSSTRQIVSYDVDGTQYGIIRNFLKYQSPKKPRAYYPLPSVPLGKGFPTSSEQVPNQYGKPSAEGEGEGKGVSPISPYEGDRGKKPKYAFERKVVRLTKEDLDGWRTSYRNIANIEALLESRDAWLSENPGRQKNWFASTSTWLANKDAEAAANAPSPPDPDRETRKAQREAERIKREEAEGKAHLERMAEIDKRETERSILELAAAKAAREAKPADEELPPLPEFLRRA